MKKTMVPGAPSIFAILVCLSVASHADEALVAAPEQDINSSELNELAVEPTALNVDIGLTKPADQQPAAILLPPKKSAPLYRFNVRIDPVASVFGESNLEVDYYLNNHWAVGLVGRLGSSAYSNDNQYGVVGLRFNRYFETHNQSGWYFSMQPFSYVGKECHWQNNYIYEPDSIDPKPDYSSVENCAYVTRIGAEFSQNWQWLFANGFNVNLGLGGKVVKTVTELDYTVDEYYEEPFFWRAGIYPAFESSIGWAF